MPAHVLPRSFYERPTLQVAKDVLGKCLVLPATNPANNPEKVGIITEVEAYIGEDDGASHAAHGRTSRTNIMYGEAGRAYVYLIYGIYHCFNIVTEAEDFPAAILIRSVWLLDEQGKIVQEINGPGKVCKAFSIDRSYTGKDLTDPAELHIENRKYSVSQIFTSPRVGITKATDRLWRFSTTLAKHQRNTGDDRNE